MAETQRAFLMVWDGLRPDMVSPEVTPNLWRLSAEGAWCDRSYAVYPSLTRANSPAISTGCRPGHAGVPGNTFLLRSADGSLVSHSSGDVGSLERLAEADQRPVLLVETLADRVHRAGGSTVIVGSGSPGSAWLQHPQAVGAGEPVIADGLPIMRGFLEAVQKRFGALPNRHALPASRWTSYFTQVITEFVLPELAPTLLVFWHTDPDHTTHARGYSAPETLQALRDADANLDTILQAYASHGLLETTAVVVTSDHGGSTIRKRFQPARDLAGALSNGAAAENGGSVFVYTSDPSAVDAIRQFDYVGPVFTADGRDGTFPLSLVGLDGPRAPDIVFSFAWSSDSVGGVPGTASGCNSKLVMDHGSISPFDLHNTLVLRGPSFRAGFRNLAPVGNVDLCPTLCYVLGIPPGPAVDGRILYETLRMSDSELEWDTLEEIREFTARKREWRQRLWFERTDSTAYLAGGTVEPL